MKYSLVCNSSSEHWPKNKNLFFLGYWCLENLKNSFKNFSKYKIINDLDKNDEQTRDDVNKIGQIYISLINDLVKSLNKLHKKNFSKKFWEIVVGPWIKVFIGIVYERYTSLEKALNNKDIDHLVLAEYELNDFSTYNVYDLETKASKNINGWDTILYTKIFEHLKTSHSITKVKFTKNNKNLKIKKLKIKKLKYYFIKILSLINFFSSKRKKYFFYKNEIKLKHNLLLNLYLKELPQIPFEIIYQYKEINSNLRNNFDFKKENILKIESFIRKILPIALPTDVVENFDNLLDISKNTNWPEKPKLIFSSHAFHNDEIFKFYLAQKVEQNSIYIALQHGSNYFTGKNTIIQPDYSTCDKFFSWGNVSQEKCHSLFNTKNIYIKKIQKNNGKKILFLAPKMSSQRKRPYDDYGKMIRENIILEEILFNLKQDIKRNVIIKIHSNDYESLNLENKILEEIIFKREKFNINRTKINNKLIKQSKILVHPGDYTGFLESMAIGIPTICILSNLNWIREEARDDFKKLIYGKILFNHPRDVSEHINKVYNNVEEWWNSSEVQLIRKIFCDKYSKPAPPNPIKKIASTLKNYI